MHMRIEAIKVVGRYRRDLGDLGALASSIASVGLINPITVTSDGQLIAGQRRLEACRLLGRDTIEALIADDLDTAAERLTAERDENTERQQMTPQELVALGRALEDLERPKARERQVTSFNKGSVQLNGTVTTSDDKPRLETRKVVGEALGWSGTTYERAKAVVDAASDTTLEPEDQKVARQALAEMNASGIVNSSYEKIRKGRDAALGARQRPVLADVKKQRHAIASAAASLSGIALGLNRIEELHPEITGEEAAQWVGDLSEARLSIERLVKRLKERINA